VRVWEPQHLDPSNLNRYVLMRRPMLPMSKIAMLEHWQRGTVSISGFDTLVNSELVARIQPWAPWVFVGDNIEAPRLVQRDWPQHLGDHG
jgi:hypothetical protein